MFSEFSFIGTLFLSGILRWACCVGLRHSQPEALPLQPGGVSLELGLWPIFPPWDTEGAIENRVQGTSGQTMSRAFPAPLLPCPPNITIFVLCFFSDFSTFSKCPAKLFKKRVPFLHSYAFPTGPDGCNNRLGNGPPRRMGRRDPWGVHTGLWFTRLFCQNPFFTRSPTVLGSFLEITL